MSYEGEQGTKGLCEPSRFEGTPRFTRQTAWKEVETFIVKFDPDTATRQELFLYQDYLDSERALVQRNLSVLGLAERLYEERTRTKRAIESTRANIKYGNRRLKELGVVEPKTKQPKSKEAKNENK